MHMRTTLILDDKIVEQARELTGIQGKTALIYRGLRELIAHESARMLAAMGGSRPGMRAVPRRRSKPVKTRP